MKSIKKKEKFCIKPPAINSSPKNPELWWPWLFKPIILKPKILWKITSIDIIVVDKAAVTKKYLKLITSYSLKRYIIIIIKKNLKNIIDFINLTKLTYSYPSKYKDLIKLKLVEKKITKNNRKITFKTKSNFIFKIFSLKWKIPNPQNSSKFMLVIKFPKIKLMGKKQKIKFTNNGVLL